MQYLVEDLLLTADEFVFSAALVCGSVECVLYLLDVGCPCNFVYVEVSKGLDDSAVLLCVQHVREHGSY